MAVLWEREALAAMDRFQALDPAGYDDYLAELRALDFADAEPLDEWLDPSRSA